MTYAVKQTHNMNEYSKGYFNGREYEQERIAAILNSYPELDIPAECMIRIFDGNEQHAICLSKDTYETVKADQQYFGRRKALGDVAAYLENFVATWDRPKVLNPRRLILDLAKAIRGLD